ncbi:hypothetical protein [Enterococcus sp. DIV1411a]|uniref:hypothetical protein n=1 Tax=Enterococcus sp. DIV1411a TaxID=2774779 RepID=UPI003D2FBED7
MMDFAVLVVVAFFATVFASVIFGKELDEKEKQAIAKEKIESKKKKRKLLEKAKANGTINKKVLGKTLKSLIIDEEHQHGSHFDK